LGIPEKMRMVGLVHELAGLEDRADALQRLDPPRALTPQGYVPTWAMHLALQRK
jgi:hypothetical protein